MTRLCIYYYEGLSCGPDKFVLYRALIFYKNVVPPVGLLVLSPGRETKFDEPIKVFLPGFFLSFEAWLNKKGKKLPPFSFWHFFIFWSLSWRVLLSGSSVHNFFISTGTRSISSVTKNAFIKQVLGIKTPLEDYFQKVTKICPLKSFWAALSIHQKSSSKNFLSNPKHLKAFKNSRP